MVGSSMAYGASKAGLINLTQDLARALAPEARANAVAPGFVDTEWTRPWPAERKQAAIERSLLTRACTPATARARASARHLPVGYFSSRFGSQSDSAGT